MLRSRGHDTHTPTLSGCGYLAGKNRHEGNDLSDFITDIRNYIDAEGLSEIIMIAHSFSSMICGAIMKQIPDRIRQDVFIDGIIPESNRSFAETAGQSFQLMLAKHLQEDGAVRPWPLSVFGVQGADADWFETRLRPFSHTAFHSPFPGTFDPQRVTTSYISCQETASPFFRAMAMRATDLNWPVLPIKSGHCPMVTSPVALTRAVMMQATSGLD